MKKNYSFFLGIILVLFYSCQVDTSSEEKLSVSFEKYSLENGLDVVLHQDKSDPIVSLAIQYHVGSNREVPGKTGFAHLFEHMMFQESENVGQDQFFKKIQGAGGTLNGGTGNDGTVYYEIVPKNALEMVLWLESDRMGYLANTVTKSAFANQQNVVQNEKRQMVDNRPYGHNQYVISKNLYPEGHPYNWTVIGEMEDLFNATVEDVKEFHAKYYVPNNATLVLAGDFETEDAKQLINKYFGEIADGEKVVDLEPMPVELKEIKKLYHEDNFAKTPLLTMVWPVVEQYNPEAYALDFLAEILGQGKKSPMYRVLVKDKKLTSRARVYNRSMELAGNFTISVNANAGESLADVENAIFEAFTLFEEEGITESDLEKIKAGLETGFYNGISSVLGKSFQLARYNEYAGSPDFIEQDIANIQAVTIEDIQGVYNKYIKGHPYLSTSFVPKGKLDLIAENSVKVDIVEESIADATEVKAEATEVEEVAKTPSSFDRSLEPEKGVDPEITVPTVWTSSTSNGINIWGIEQDEVPLVQYSLLIDGAHLLETAQTAGISSFMADMLMEGTALKTPIELEEAIDLLGARIRIYGGTEAIAINVNTLARNFEKTLDLVEEILLQPRWDEEQFEIVKSRKLNSIKRNKANPSQIARNTFNKLVYGEGHILSVPSSGTEESIEAISIDNLKEFYASNISPTVCRMHVAGKIKKDRVEKALANLTSNWEAKEVTIPEVAKPKPIDASAIYFVDVPGAKQSVIYIGNYSLAKANKDYYPATVINYKLGGSFNGIVNMILREEKGFTYGARTSFYGAKNYGSFTASSSVRSNATLESVTIFKEEMEKYIQGVSEEDLEFTKNALLKANALRFETLRSLLDLLSEISAYDRPADFVKQEESFLRSLTKEIHQEYAQKYIDPSKMVYLVVGDAETQLDALEEVGLGKPILIEN